MSNAPSDSESSSRASIGSLSFKGISDPQLGDAAQTQTVKRRVKLRRHVSPTSVRTVLARVPRVAWACALIAFLNAAAWSIVTPPFQGRDEPAHFAYVQILAQTGTLPREVEGNRSFSPDEEDVLIGLRQAKVGFSPQTPALSSRSEQQTLEHDVNAGLSPIGSGRAGVATTEPPLYYALETIPYALGGGNVLRQLELMRLLSALLAGITALLICLFLRELLPGLPWAATAGALCIAVQPLFGFMSGTLNPDTLLYTVSAALFLCLARGFRRGLNRSLACAIGLLLAIGFITKLNFVGVAFGVFIGLIVLVVREVGSNDPGTARRYREALQSPALAIGIGGSPVILYGLVNLLSNHPAFGYLSGIAGQFTKGSIFDEFSYVWTLYLPRLPGMTHYIEGISTTRDIWFNRSVGLYGWIDTEFPEWVNTIALVPAGAIALLCGRALVMQRAVLRSRLPELLVYGSICLGVLVMVGLTSYTADALLHSEAYGDPRYLLPMLALLGAVLALAVRGAGRRWAPATAAALVVLFLAHDIFSQLQAIARYYG
jgi:hypothetical protein